MVLRINNLWRDYKRALDAGDLKCALSVTKCGAQSCKKEGDLKHAAIWERATSNVFYLQGKYEKAARQAISSAKEQPDKYEKALSFVAVGQMQTFAGKYQSAFYYFREAARLGAEFSNDTYFWTHLYGIRALAYRRTGKFDKAIIDWEGSAELLRQQGQLRRAAAYLNSIGFLLLSGKHVREAEQRLLDALELIEQDPHADTEAAIYDSLGCVYTLMGNYSDAERFLRRAIKVFSTLGNKAQIAGSLLHLSDLHQKMARYDDAHETAVRALDLGLELKNEPLIAEAREQLKNLTLSQIRERRDGPFELEREAVAVTPKIVRLDDYRGPSSRA
jgi:tetratricopeptide (TPR) repeat protein